MFGFRPYITAHAQTRRQTWPRGVVLAVLVVSLVAGCGVKQVTVKNSFPAPIMQKHRQHIALYMDAALRNYVHTEELPGGGDWSIDLGAANVALFTQIFTGMFAQVTSVQNLQTVGVAEAIVQPAIEDYQFSTPNQNQTEFFEAWIKYRIRFYNRQGKLLAQWPVTAYGRSEKKFLDKEGALRAATKNAMRDAAAGMVLDFDNHPVVRAFLYGPSSKPAVVNRDGQQDAS